MWWIKIHLSKYKTIFQLSKLFSNVGGACDVLSFDGFAYDGSFVTQIEFWDSLFLGERFSL